MTPSRTPVTYHGKVTVSTTGSAVQVSTTSVKCKSFTLVALTTNAGKIYVGGSDVDSSTHDGLEPGDTFSCEVESWTNLSDWYIDAANNGDGADVHGVTA